MQMYILANTWKSEEAIFKALPYNFQVAKERILKTSSCLRKLRWSKDGPSWSRSIGLAR